MTYLPFANDRAALREQPRCSSRTANESIKRNWEKRFICSGERQVIMYISSYNIVQIHIGLIYIKHISVKSSRTTRGQPGLPLFTDWYTMYYVVQGQPDSLFRNTCFIWMFAFWRDEYYTLSKFMSNNIERHNAFSMYNLYLCIDVANIDFAIS